MKKKINLRFFWLVLIIGLTISSFGSSSSMSSTVPDNTGKDSKLVMNEKGVKQYAQNGLDSLPPGPSTVYYNFKADLKSEFADTETVSIFKEALQQLNGPRDALLNSVVQQLDKTNQLKETQLKNSEKKKRSEAIAYLILFMTWILSLIGLRIATVVNAESMKYFLTWLCISLTVLVILLQSKAIYFLLP